MTYLLDTNILSELVKGRKNPGVLDWLASTTQRDHHVSAMSMGELRRGVGRLELRNDRRQAARLGSWLEETLIDYDDRIVPVTADVALRWGHHDAARPTSVADGLIGATAEVHGWTLVTRNVKDFEHLPIELHNPFTPEEAP
jgi:toxin FitB